MAKSKTNRPVARQTGQLESRTAATLARSRKTTGRAAIKRRQGSTNFIREFPWASGILTVAILAGLVGILINNHVGPFAVKKAVDPCDWAINPSAAAYAPAKDPKTVKRTYSAAPRSCITKTTGGLYTATVTTKYGSFVMVLDQANSPATVNNFVFLATHNFYDGLTFHRLDTSINIIQGGDPYSIDPTANASKIGTGGPGYTIPDEYPQNSQLYAQGCVAMANAGKGTTGSQFFICTADDLFKLQPQYNVLGKVTPDTFGIVQKIQKDDVMESITIAYDKTGTPGVYVPSPTPAAATVTPTP